MSCSDIAPEQRFGSIELFQNLSKLQLSGFFGSRQKAKTKKLFCDCLWKVALWANMCETNICWKKRKSLLMYPSRRHNLPPTLEIIIRSFPKNPNFPKISELFPEFPLARGIAPPQFFSRNFVTLVANFGPKLKT